MEKETSNILRTSIYTFFQSYQHLTTMAAILAFPYSSYLLLSQLFIPSSHVLPSIHSQLKAISQAMGFPLSSQYLFTLLISKLSQTISSSIFVLPFTFSFFLITKSYPLLITYVCNFICLISANSTAFSLLFFAFNLFEGFGFSSSSQWILFVLVSGFLLYSFIVANAFIICNLALVSSAMEEHSGFLAILKACILLRGRTLTGLTLAVVVNLALAAIEALFHYRVVRAYHGAGGLTGFPMALEGILIAYLYSVFVVVDTIVSFMFFKSCKTGWLIDQQCTCSYRIEIMEE
ncbi:hypothetical protein GOBAR_AA21841 [Gossypium barbadense]|uniref:Uncharacterized protein n=1 Tax=Gossypium barbadense TaxID=3634 RepID=A0A2P5X677_GOSBA|nr:hypothetical protein GOBAR_AA21841 [Gossypium barbadense]